MTEPKEFPGADVPGKPHLDPAASWPELPSGLFPEAAPEVGDPAVEALLGRLGALPSTPVAAHSGIYAALHDELLEALNEDVAGQASAVPDVPAPTQPPSARPGDTAQ